MLHIQGLLIPVHEGMHVVYLSLDHCSLGKVLKHAKIVITVFFLFFFLFFPFLSFLSLLQNYLVFFPHSLLNVYWMILYIILVYHADWAVFAVFNLTVIQIIYFLNGSLDKGNRKKVKEHQVQLYTFTLVIGTPSINYLSTSVN